MENVRISEIKDCPSWIGKIKDLGDANSKNIGFYPEGAFNIAAEDNLIILARDNENLLGYLLFRYVRRDNTISITHLCTAESARNNGIAELLVDYLKEKVSKYNGIFLKCRKDYNLHSFWQRLGFVPRGETPGRSVKKDTILVKWWFNNQNTSLQRSLFTPSGTYKAVVDANVLFDLDTNESNQAKVLLADWLDEIDLCVTTEIFTEILRNNDPLVREQSRKSASNYMLLNGAEDLDNTVKKLESFLPSNSESQISDIKQIAHSIVCGAKYFITQDGNLLSKSSEINNLSDLLVIHPTDFIVKLHRTKNEDIYKPFRLLNLDVETRKVTENDLEHLFNEFSHSNERKASFIRNLRSHLAELSTIYSQVVTIEDQIEILFVYKITKHSLEIELLRFKHEPAALTVLNKVIFDLISEASSEKKDQVIITDDIKENNVELNQLLEKYGFIYMDERWVKYNLSNIFSSFSELQKILESDSKYKGYSAHSNPEVIFWPCKVLGYCSTFIVSIEPYWAKELFDIDQVKYDLFGAEKHSLIFRNQNVYYRSASNYGIKENDRILWYVKDEKLNKYSKSIRAISIVDTVEVGPASNIFKQYKNSGIYKWENIKSLSKNDPNRNIMAIAFRNTEIFTKNIEYTKILDTLNNHSIKSNNFQAPLKISDDAFLDIYKQGF